MSFSTVRQIKKTRRSYKCEWCHEKIEKGSQCVDVSGVWDGDFYGGRFHPECNDAVTRYYTKHKCWGEEMPEGPMNRGGIEERGETEEPAPLSNP